jgi:hypothetical protein
MKVQTTKGILGVLIIIKLGTPTAVATAILQPTAQQVQAESWTETLVLQWLRQEITCTWHG